MRVLLSCIVFLFFFFQAEDGIRDFHVTGVQTCALPIFANAASPKPDREWRGCVPIPLCICRGVRGAPMPPPGRGCNTRYRRDQAGDLTPRGWRSGPSALPSQRARSSHRHRKVPQTQGGFPFRAVRQAPQEIRALENAACGFARRLRPRPVSRGGPRGSWYGKQSEPNQTDLETTTPIFLPTPFTRVSSSGSNKVLKAHDTIAKTARNGHHCN